MLGTLIQKDLRRLRANWRGFVVLLAMPICITGLVGGVFGPSARNGDVPKIRIAIVDEDESVIGGFLGSAVTGQQAGDFIDATTATREEAMAMISRNEISAFVVLPAGFSRDYLLGERPPAIELVKNPTQAYMPAIAEELLRVLVELLDAISKNALTDMPEIRELIDEPGMPDATEIARIVTRVRDKIERAEGYLFPPVIGLKTIEQVSNSEGADEPASFNIFAFVMPGLAAMFLLFTAEGTIRDLFAERRTRTLDRYRTVCSGLLPFFSAKAIYSFLVVLLSALIILVGGGLIFGITWKSVLPTICVTVCYSVFCVGFAYLMASVIYRERLAGILNTVFIMMIAFLGGSMLPSETLPPFLRGWITPWMPNHAYAVAIKRLQFDSPGPDWAVVSLVLLISGLALLTIAIVLFQRRLLRGDAE